MFTTSTLPKLPEKLHLTFLVRGFKPPGPWKRPWGWTDPRPRGEAPTSPQIHRSVTSRCLRVKSSICSLCKCCRLPGGCPRLCPLSSRAYGVFININKYTCAFCHQLPKPCLPPWLPHRYRQQASPCTASSQRFITDFSCTCSLSHSSGARWEKF